MDYWKQVCLRAWADTWALVVGSTLSLIIVSAVIVIVSLLIYRKWAGAEAMRDQLIGAASALIATILVGAALFFFNLLFVSPKKLYEEALQQQQHSIKTTDPVFANIIYLLQAFRMYRIAIGHDAQCTIYVTAPPDSISTASMVAQFSIATSNCGTFGPHGTDLPPTLEKEILDGSVGGTVIVNAPESDKAADGLMNHLGSVFRVKRGYKSIPAGRLAASIPANYVWLQFGVNTKFDSELRREESTKQQ